MGARAEVFEDAVAAAKNSNAGSVLADILHGWSIPPKALATAKPEVEAPFKLTDDVFKRISPKELVNTSEKVLGGSKVYVEEGTQFLQSKYARTSALSLRALSRTDSDVERAIEKANFGTTAPESFRTKMGNAIRRPMPLSEAGESLYKSSDNLSNFADAVEKAGRGDRYSTIIADDVSGRLPALLIHDRLQRVAELRGTEPPRLMFMAGGFPGVGHPGGLYGSMEDGRLTDMMRRIEEAGTNLKHGRSLLVTEIISSGNSIKQFNAAFQKTGVPFDIAAMNAPPEQSLWDTIGNNQFDLIEGNGTGRMYAGGAGSDKVLRGAIGVEKYGMEATSRKTDFDPQKVSQLRTELYDLGRYLFERSH